MHEDKQVRLLQVITKKDLIFAQDHVKILYKTDQRIEYDTDAETSYQRNYSKPPLIANTK